MNHSGGNDIMGLVFVVALAVGLPIYYYNKLVSLKNMALSAFSSMDVMLKKRYDLIPNLISAVQAYMKHERGTLSELTELRTKAMSASITPEEKMAVEGQISHALKGLMVQVEAYPDLKASNNFVQLQGSLNVVEEDISASRRNYNASVVDYNNGLEQFPSNLFAGLMRLKPMKMFEITEAERQNVDVKSLFKAD
ncbi:MAG: LemA family protein [Deltaproteobacteria bacterium]|nr:LemA family protein [Deltaproteobacteria bacterium]